MTFATPILLLLVPALSAVFAWRRWRRRPARVALAVADIEALRVSRPSRPGWRLRLGWVPGLLRVLAILLFAVALARPQRGLALTFIPEQGIDLVLALDMSGSMTQSIVQPSGRAGPTKLDAARTVIRDFITTLDGDRVGLVIFQSRSLVLSPLTVDRIAVQRSVSAVQPGLLPDGTAIGLGAAEALNLLRNSSARSRVVVLLTDGENNAGDIDPLQAARLAKTLGIRMYTIGFVQRAGSGDVDAAMLKRIASDTGGAYFDASTQAELAKAYTEIGALERSRVGERRFTQYQELAPWLVGTALILLTAEVALRASLLRRYP